MSFPRKFTRFLSREYTAGATKPRTRSAPKVRAINKVDSKYRAFVVHESQKALTEYLHTTRSVPFYFAEQIGKNSPFCLSTLVSNVHFSARTFPTTIRTFLAYEPIDEFEFFLESIGIDHLDIPKHLPRNKHFLSEDKTLLESALALSHFGFPWHMLGRLYTHQPSIFAMSSLELNSRVDEIRESGASNNLYAVGVCLAFPHLLSPRGASDPSLLEDLKWVFEELDKSNANVDDWVDVCCKVRVFYELGLEKGTVGQPVCDKLSLFLECPKHVIDDKADYFCKFVIVLGSGPKTAAVLEGSQPVAQTSVLDLTQRLLNISNLRGYIVTRFQGLNAVEPSSERTEEPLSAAAPLFETISVVVDDVLDPIGRLPELFQPHSRGVAHFSSTRLGFGVSQKRLDDLELVFDAFHLFVYSFKRVCFVN